MSQLPQWHLSKAPSSRVISKQEQKRIRILIAVFGVDETQETETKCGVKVPSEQLRTYEQYIDDKGANPEMWCPFCFGA